MAENSVFEMSDEDFLNTPPEQLMQSSEVDESAQADSVVSEEQGDVDAVNDEQTLDDSVTDESTEEGSEEQDDGESDNNESDEKDDTLENVDTDGSDTDDSKDDSEEESEKDDEGEKSEAEQQLAQLFAPFKANGKMLNVNSVDEAITLMQRGANYNKKMSALKPGFKMMKMLENNKMLDENTVSYLIDLHNKKPEAIQKLLKDSNFDVDEFDSEKDVSYAPTDEHVVTDEAMAFDDALDSIRDSDTYLATMKVVGEEWDDSSKGKLVQNPELIVKLNEHMSNGVYEKIATEIARRSALGTLGHLSNLDAYFAVGGELMQAGAFATEETPPTSKVDDATKLADEAAKAAKAKAESKRKDKKRAASSTRARKPVQHKQEFNPFAMDDDEFMKDVGNSLY